MTFPPPTFRKNKWDLENIPRPPKVKVLRLAKARFVAAKESVICLGPSATNKTNIAPTLRMTGIKATYRFHSTQDAILA